MKGRGERRKKNGEEKKRGLGETVRKGIRQRGRRKNRGKGRREKRERGVGVKVGCRVGRVTKSGLGYASQPRGSGKKWTTDHTNIAYKEAKAKRTRF